MRTLFDFCDLRVAAVVGLLVCVSVCRAQSGLLEARIIEGDAQTSQPGSRLPRPLVLEVTDETGSTVESALVSFQVPQDGASGRFHNGLRTEILKTGGDGRVSLNSLETGIIAGQFQIRMVVAKGAARTGVVSNQLIAASAPGEQSGSSIASHLSVLKPNRRALEIGALSIAAAAVAYTKINHANGNKSTVTPQPTIGAPTITVSK